MGHSVNGGGSFLCTDRITSIPVPQPIHNDTDSRANVESSAPRVVFLTENSLLPANGNVINGSGLSKMREVINPDGVPRYVDTYQSHDNQPTLQRLTNLHPPFDLKMEDFRPLGDEIGAMQSLNGNYQVEAPRKLELTPVYFDGVEQVVSAHVKQEVNRDYLTTNNGDMPVYNSPVDPNASIGAGVEMLYHSNVSNATNGNNAMSLSRSPSPMTPPNTVAPESDGESPQPPQPQSSVLEQGRQPGSVGVPSIGTTMYRETAHSIFRSTSVEEEEESSNLPLDSHTAASTSASLCLGTGGEGGGGEDNSANAVAAAATFAAISSEGTKKYTLPPRFMGKNSKYF